MYRSLIWLASAGPEPVAIGPNQPSQLHRVATKERRQEVRLIDDFVQPECLRPVETRPVKQLKRFARPPRAPGRPRPRRPTAQ